MVGFLCRTDRLMLFQKPVKRCMQSGNSMYVLTPHFIAGGRIMWHILERRFNTSPTKKDWCRLCLRFFNKTANAYRPIQCFMAGEHRIVDIV